MISSMTQTLSRLACLILSTGALIAQTQTYPLGPDSQRQDGVPRGTVTKHTWTSQIYPGTVRDYWVYVPAQYQPDKAACVMVFQDGGGYVTDDGAYRVPIVFDNLIHRGEMPVTIGILINPGMLPALKPDQKPRNNRSYEYDGIGDRYSRFLLDEIIPEVAKQYNLSTDPNDRAISGASSGGIVSFTVAWNHPEAFRRVLSYIGSFTRLRGGETYATLIRKTEPKPLRVYLQDGSNDLNIFAGSWFIANQDVYAALKWAGYDTTFTIGTEGHNTKHGGAILPDALRWLWREYPKPIAASAGGGADRQIVTDILDPGSNWEVVSTGHKFTEGPAADGKGNVFFVDPPNSRIHKIAADGKVTVFKENAGGAAGLMFGPDGRLYACQEKAKRVAAYTMDGAESVIAEGGGITSCNDLAVSKRGDVYFTDPPSHKVWYVDTKGNKRVVNESLIFPNGLRFSPDESTLIVADSQSKWMWSFQVQLDGSLTQGEPFYQLETWDENSASAADGLALDDQGNVYVATRTGLQVCDPSGLVTAIISKPQDGPLSNVVFGGPDMQTLYVTAGDKVFKRHIRRKGIAKP